MSTRTDRESRETLLEVEDLKTNFYTRAGVVRAVQGVSFTLDKGETLGIVGESGSGKSVTALSLIRLVPQPPGRFDSGRVVVQGKPILRVEQRTGRRSGGGG